MTTTATTAEPTPTAKELLAGIEHIVVLMMENRSFDHMLGALKMDPGYAARAQVEGLTGTESNPSASGGKVQVHRLDNFTVTDPNHEWDSCHAQFDLGKNDGFESLDAKVERAEGGAPGCHGTVLPDEGANRVSRSLPREPIVLCRHGYKPPRSVATWLKADIR